MKMQMRVQVAAVIANGVGAATACLLAVAYANDRPLLWLGVGWSAVFWLLIAAHARSLSDG